MYRTRIVPILLAVLLGLVSCTRDPNVAKVRYLESGNKYFAKGKYKEARIMYKNALQKDQRFGPAYYKLGLAALQLGSGSEAVQALRRALELLPPTNPDHWNAGIRLSEIYLAVGRTQKDLLNDVDRFCADLLKKDPNSFDGHRLLGDLNFARSLDAYSTARKDDGQRLLGTAIAEYEKANTIKPGQVSVLLQLARTYAGSGNYAKAEQLFHEVLDKDKSHQAAYTELYRLLMFEKKFADAEQLLKTAFQNNPKQYYYLTSLAAHYAMLGKRDAMLQTLQEIKSHAGDYPQAYQVVGDFYLRLGDGDSAIKEYREGAGKDASNKLTYEKRIIEVLMRQGKRAEAADLNSQILKDHPNDPDAKGLAATFMLDKGDVARALSELQALVTRAPDNPVARFNLGRAHLARHEWEEARQAFQKAVELRPDYVMARLALAQLQVSRGDYDGALTAANQILAIDRNNLNARLIQSAALMGQKKFGDSQTLLEGMAKASPASPSVFYQLGVVNLAQRKFKDAEDAFRKAYQLNPANSRGLMGVVQTDLAQNKPDAALQLLRDEVAKSPDRTDLRLALGNTAAQTGHFDEALGAFTAYLNGLDKNSKQRGDAYLLIGEVYRRKNDDASAIANLQQARQILPDNSVVLSTLALTLDHAGKWSEAKQVYESALKVGSDNGIVLNNLAYLMAEHNGDLDDALTKAGRAKQLLPNTAEVSDTLGWIYLKKNLSDSAIQIFKELVQKAPNQATFRYHLAMAYSQKGDKPNAIKELQQALKESPSKDEKDKIQQLLSRLNGA
jgi:tetratricopeptide (TPR) repeat protein